MDLMEYNSIEEKYGEDIGKVLRYLWLMWAGCFGAIIVLILMAEIVGGRIREEMAPSNVPVNLLIVVFIALAIGAEAAAVIFRKAFLSGKMNNYHERTRKYYERSQWYGDKPGFVSKCRFGLYVPVVISGVPAFTGWFLFMVGADKWLFYLFIIVGAVGMIVHIPKRDDIIGYIITDQKGRSQESN